MENFDTYLYIYLDTGDPKMWRRRTVM